MLFCQLGRAQSLREISGGLASCLGILNRNPHTALQSCLLPKDLNELDYIGQMENMKAVENKLSQVLDEEVKFDRLNVGQNVDYNSINIDAYRFNHIFSDDYEKLKDFFKPFKKQFSCPMDTLIRE